MQESRGEWEKQGGGGKQAFWGERCQQVGEELGGGNRIWHLCGILIPFPGSLGHSWACWICAADWDTGAATCSSTGIAVAIPGIRRKVSSCLRERHWLWIQCKEDTGLPFPVEDRILRLVEDTRDWICELSMKCIYFFLFCLLLTFDSYHLVPWTCPMVSHALWFLSFTHAGQARNTFVHFCWIEEQSISLCLLRPTWFTSAAFCFVLCFMLSSFFARQKIKDNTHTNHIKMLFWEWPARQYCTV